MSCLVDKGKISRQGNQPSAEEGGEHIIGEACADSKHHGLAFVEPKWQNPVELCCDRIWCSVKKEAANKRCQERQECSPQDVLSTLLFLLVAHLHAPDGRWIDTILFIYIRNRSNNGSYRERKGCAQYNCSEVVKFIRKQSCIFPEEIIDCINQTHTTRRAACQRSMAREAPTPGVPLEQFRSKRQHSSLRERVEGAMENSVPDLHREHSYPQERFLAIGK